MTSPDALAILAKPEHERVDAVADLLRERNSLEADMADLIDIGKANKRHLAEVRKVLCGDRYSGSALLDIARVVVADADAARAERDRLLSILRDVSEALSGGEVPAEDLARTVSTVMHSNAAHLERVTKERDDLRARLAPIKALDLDAPRCPFCHHGARVVYRAVGEHHDWSSGGYFRIWPDGEWVVNAGCCGDRWGHGNPIPRFKTLRDTLPADVLAALEAAQGVSHE